jgi:preflagellin peptidase FlaK
MDELTWARIGLAIAVMVLASISDWRSRMASDKHWYILGLVGSLLLGWQLYDEGAPWIYFVCLALITLVFMDLLWDRPGIFEDGVAPLPLSLYIATILAFGYLSLEHFNQPQFWMMLTIPILFILFFVLYQLDVIKGGADAKSLIALALMFAAYPGLDGFPLLELNNPAAQDILPFPLLVLFNGAILTLLVPLGLFLVNLVRRDFRFPLMFFGSRIPIDEAPSKQVWSMEKVVDGSIKTILFPRSDDEGDWEGLRAAGIDRPWVTPKVPFLIPLTLSVPFSLLVGNLLLYIVGV